MGASSMATETEEPPSRHFLPKGARAQLMALTWRNSEGEVVSLFEAATLLWANLQHGLNAYFGVLGCIARIVRCHPSEDCEGVDFLEGFVSHTRGHERTWFFKYAVRMALIDLDAPPPWWALEPVGRLSADAARVAAGTTGKVRLLTTPSSFGYDQNPVQVYYCLDADGQCRVGICEVTNAPFNHHVFFSFDLDGSQPPKPLHESPLMDLEQRWQITSSPPQREGLEVQVDVLPRKRANSADDTSPIDDPSPTTPREPTPMTRAHLELRPSSWPHARSEQAGSLLALLRFGLQPHRTTVRLYYNAVQMLRNGFAFSGHPTPQYKRVGLRAVRAGEDGLGCPAA